ncbi:MAG: DUF2844 domain-containing protein [Ramlibacter sp.]
MPRKRTFVVGLAFCAVSAVAGLAGDRDTAAGLPGRTVQKTTAAAVAYSEWVRKLDSGTTVVEYVDTRGAVFAVTWSGPFLPDLRELLGPHFPSLALQQQRASSLHAPVVVRTDEVVIVSGGRMGAFDGRAWLPQRLPAGFDPRSLP